jgi:hypothetical protein
MEGELMASDRLSQAVRRHLSLGRLVPLGAPEDGAWLAERAAGRVLRRAAAAAVPDVRVDGVRLALADAGAAAAAVPVVPPPPAATPALPGGPPLASGLPAGPLRIEAACAAGVERPLPECVREVRAALAAAAREGLGLDVAAVDVHVAALLDEEEGPRAETVPERERETEMVRGGGAVADAVLAVPGVLGLSGALGGPSHAVRIMDCPDSPDSPSDEAPGRVVRLQLVVAGERRTLDVVREARASAAKAAADGAPGPVTVSVLVTEVADDAAGA